MKLLAILALVVVNQSGLTIDKLYIGPQNRLTTILPNKQSTTIQIKPDRYDMVLVFGRSKITWTDFDLTTVSKLTFQRIGNRINAHYELAKLH